ncbi:ANK_REP_REGION domain-containing protein [Trichonephila clavipes]|nr:ANK_REP_REGION domain-containing protein [Trichonephila clavipes]
MAAQELDPVLPMHNVTTVIELRELLRKGADINEINAFEETPLHSALRRETDSGLIQQMVLHGANIDAKDIWGVTPLYCAVTRHGSDLETIKFLLEHGADIKSRKRQNDRLLDNTVTHNRKSIELVIKYKFIRNFPKVRRFKINVLYNNARDFYKQYKRIVDLNLKPACYAALSEYLDGCAIEFLQMRSVRIHGSLTLEKFLIKKNPLQTITDRRTSLQIMNKILLELYGDKYPIYEEMIINQIQHKDLLIWLDSRIDELRARCSAGLSIRRLGHEETQKGPDKLELTRVSGYKFQSSSAKGPVDLLHPEPEMSLELKILEGSAGLSNGARRGPEGPDKLELTRFSGYKFRSSSSKGACRSFAPKARKELRVENP